MCRKTITVRAEKIGDREKEEAGALSRLGRKLLSELFLQETGEPFREEDLSFGPQGKPGFFKRPEIEFNISHSGGWAVCALGDVPVGIDVQEQRPLHKQERLAEKILSSAEKTRYEVLGEQGRRAYLYDCWVEKEARVKGTGEGLSRSLDHLPEDGVYEKIELEEGYSCGIWMKEKRNLVIERIEKQEKEERIDETSDCTPRRSQL